MKKNILLLSMALVCILCKSQVPVYATKVYDHPPGGYYFLSAKNNDLILDENGVLVFYAPMGLFGVTFNLLTAGLMVYSDPPNFYFLDSTFRIIDSVACKGLVKTDPHEIRILPNGHFLLLGMDSIRMDLSKYFWKGKHGSDSANVQCAVIQELDKNRNVVFEWHGKDHFVFDDVDTFYLTSSTTVDLTHSNALELDNDGNILLCSRNLNEITKINRKDGSIIWRFGGRRNQFRFVNCLVPFYGQHDIRRITNGHLTLFDNGYNFIPHVSRAMEFEMNEESKVATLKWSYTLNSKLKSTARGSMQKVDSAYTVISYGENTDRVCFVVLDRNGKKLLQVDSLVPYRVLHYYMLPWQIHRPQITCVDSSGKAYLEAETGYASYLWNSGQISQRIVAEPGKSYQVFVPQGIGFIGSEKVTATPSPYPFRKPKSKN